MSRTLGFIAGLTLPAGIYYVSTLHIRGTADLISGSLHDKSLRLSGSLPSNDGDGGDDVLPPTTARAQEGLSAAVQRRWNAAVSTAHAGLTETDWAAYGSRAWRSASSLAPSGEQVEERVVALRQAGIDAELDARHRLSDAAERASREMHEKAHDAKRAVQEGAHVAEERARSLGEKLAADASEARRRAESVGARIAQEATDLRRRAAAAVNDAKQRVTPDEPIVETLEGAYERAAQEAREAATEAKIQAVDRWRAMLDAAEETAADRHKRLLAELGPKRVGFVR